MVDVRPPSASARWLAELPPPASDEPEIFAIIREESTTFEEDPTQNSEGLLLAESAAQALATDGFGDKPLTVLAASDTSIVSDGLDADLGARFVAIWWELQEGLAGLSTAGELVKVDGTGHDMPIERPDAIVDAIDAILGE
jgi:pimeloyl-ACP methyl ester carboxylesterase